jgi:hypothetical protein
MSRPVALYHALDLAATPSLASVVRRAALPEGVLDLIKIAARCPETSERAARLTGRLREDVREAAIVYLQTALFSPSADCYRVLGVARDASQDEIRQHLRWLMKWLHPDRRSSGWNATFAERVLGAWDELKSPERRARYDRLHPPLEAATSTRSRRQWRRPWLPWVQMPLPARRTLPVWARPLTVGIAIGLVALTIALGSEWYRRSLPASASLGDIDPPDLAGSHGTLVDAPGITGP